MTESGFCVNIVGDQSDATTGGANQGIFLKCVLCLILTTRGSIPEGSEVKNGSEGKASACSAGDLGSIPGSGRSPGEGNGNPLQYSCLENPMDRDAW